MRTNRFVAGLVLGACSIVAAPAAPAALAASGTVAVKPAQSLAGKRVAITVKCSSGKLGTSTLVESGAFGKVHVRRSGTSGPFHGAATIRSGAAPRKYRVVAVCGLRPTYARGTLTVVAESGNPPAGAIVVGKSAAGKSLYYLPGRACRATSTPLAC